MAAGSPQGAGATLATDNGNVPQPMYYDRTGHLPLRKELRPTGAFGYLAQLARTEHLADLQLRAYPHSATCWATLYCGLTKFVDVFERNGKFWLKGKIARPEWDAAWQVHQPAEAFRAAGPAIERYLDAAIRAVAKRHTNEGAVQAMLCTRASALFSTIDREAVIGFADTPTRNATYLKTRKALARPFTHVRGESWLSNPPSFGGELDLLAVDDEGRLLVVEIKPGSSTKGISWAPLQAMFYAELFRLWSDQEKERSREILEAMLLQRVELKLTRDPVRRLQYPLQIVPIVAIGGAPVSPNALPRMNQVRELLAAEASYENLEVWQVEESVAMRRL